MDNSEENAIWDLHSRNATEQHKISDDIWNDISQKYGLTIAVNTVKIA